MLRHLVPDRAVLMLARECASIRLGVPEAADLERIRRLAQLTLSDFAATARRHCFSPYACCAQAVDALEQECALKRGRQAGLGFLV